MRGRQEPWDPRLESGDPQKSWPHTDHHGVDPNTSRFPSTARLWRKEERLLGGKTVTREGRGGAAREERLVRAGNRKKNGGEG